MTPDERDRLTKIEVRVDLLEKDVQSMSKSMKENFKLTNDKLDKIADLISASKGAWKALAIVGSVLTVLGGFVVGVITLWSKISSILNGH